MTMTVSTVEYININTGSSANDGTGDTLRVAFTKVDNYIKGLTDLGLDVANVNVNGALVVTNTSAPTGNSSATGIAGQIIWDSGNIYICVADNTWKRAALSSY